MLKVYLLRLCRSCRNLCPIPPPLAIKTQLGNCLLLCAACGSPPTDTGRQINSSFPNAAPFCPLTRWGPFLPRLSPVLSQKENPVGHLGALLASLEEMDRTIQDLMYAGCSVVGVGSVWPHQQLHLITGSPAPSQPAVLETFPLRRLELQWAQLGMVCTYTTQVPELEIQLKITVIVEARS